MKRLYAIRGAVCAENTKESIREQTLNMCDQIFLQNNIDAGDVVSMHFSLTKDLDVLNPCAAFRKEYKKIDTSMIPLFCTQEAYIQGGLQKVIRLIVHVYLEENSTINHIYLNGAEILRPDFSK